MSKFIFNKDLKAKIEIQENQLFKVDNKKGRKKLHIKEEKEKLFYCIQRQYEDLLNFYQLKEEVERECETMISTQINQLGGVISKYTTAQDQTEASSQIVEDSPIGNIDGKFSYSTQYTLDLMEDDRYSRMFCLCKRGRFGNMMECQNKYVTV